MFTCLDSNNSLFLFLIPDLKSTTKSGNLLDSFLTITSTKTDPQSPSFLSSLDMDPPATGHASESLVSPGASRMILSQVLSVKGYLVVLMDPRQRGLMQERIGLKILGGRFFWISVGLLVLD